MSLGVDRPPVLLPPRASERGGDSEWTQLTQARNDIDAHLLAGRLQEGGIETRTVKDRRAPGAWIYAGSNPWAPVTIFVRRFQLDDAKLILMEISLERSSRERTHTQEARLVQPVSPLLWWVAAVGLGLAFTALAIAQMGVVR